MSVKAEHYDVIRKPIITEKATMASESGAIVFEVAVESNKPQIKEAVEALFGVKVKAVNTTITKGKVCLLYTSPSPRDRQKSRMPSSA